MEVQVNVIGDEARRAPSPTARALKTCAAVAVLVLGPIACGGSGSDNPKLLIGGTVSGLAGSGLVLVNNGGDARSIASNGSFEFSMGLMSGSAYSVSVKTQPSGPNQSCTVSAASGAVASTDVTNVSVECETLDNFVYSASEDLFGWRINPTSGELTPIAPGNPLDTVLTDGAVATPDGRYMYLVNASAVNPGVTAYSVNAQTGAVTAVPNGAVAISASSTFVMSPNGQFAYVLGGAPTILGFSIDAATGQLLPIPGGPFGDGLTAAGAGFGPDGHFLYVPDIPTVSFCGCAGSLSIYAVDPDTGVLTPIVGSPFASMGVPLAITPNGKFAYTVTSTNPGYFYAGNAVAGYSVASNGALTPIPGSPFTDANAPITLTIDPSGTHLYTPGGQGTIAAFAIDATTGALSPVPGSPFATGPGNLNVSVLFVDVGGKFAFAPNANNGVSSFSIDATSGALTALASVQLVGPGFVVGFPPPISSDTTGRYIFAVNPQYNDVAVFSVDDSTGALSPVPDSPFGPTGGTGTILLVK